VLSKYSSIFELSFFSRRRYYFRRPSPQGNWESTQIDDITYHKKRITGNEKVHYDYKGVVLHV